MGCRREGRVPPASGSRPWGRKRGVWELPRTEPRGPRVGWVLRSPSALAGAGSPSVIAGSKDTVGKANGAREVSCSRSRWPKSASEPRTGLGPCSLSLGELHPEAGVLLLLGEESPRGSAGRRRRLDGALSFLSSGFFLRSRDFLGL